MQSTCGHSTCLPAMQRSREQLAGHSYAWWHAVWRRTVLWTCCGPLPTSTCTAGCHVYARTVQTSSVAAWLHGTCSPQCTFGQISSCQCRPSNYSNVSQPHSDFHSALDACADFFCARFGCSTNQSHSMHSRTSQTTSTCRLQGRSSHVPWSSPS